jgi:hypothetical protein
MSRMNTATNRARNALSLAGSTRDSALLGRANRINRWHPRRR